MTLSFLSKIDGRGGENLATAVLGTLLETSQPLASAFCSMLSRKFNKEISATALKAEFELCTDDEGKKGRIDLLITTQNFAIGIECKILNFLGDDQPEKYRSDIDARAEDYLLLVLVPRSRVTHALAAWQKQDARANGHVLTWDEVIGELLEAEEVDADSHFLARQLQRFISDYVGALDSFQSHYAAIFGEGNEQKVRNQYLTALKTLFGFKDQVLVQGASPGKWKGFTFVKNDRGIEGWYGFVRTTQLPTISHPAGVEWRLVLGLSNGVVGERQINLDSKFIECNNITGWANEWWKTWIFMPDEASFANELKLQTALEPIYSAVTRAVDAIPPTKRVVTSNAHVISVQPPPALAADEL